MSSRHNAKLPVLPLLPSLFFERRVVVLEGKNVETNEQRNGANWLNAVTLSIRKC